MQKNVFAERGFKHILGPSPAIKPGDKKKVGRKASGIL